MSKIGVVHVGAHRGEEVPQYLAEGRYPIILFEPQNLTWEPPPGVTLVRSALGERVGKLSLRVPHHIGPGLDTQMASACPIIPERAKELGWTLTPCDMVRVPVTRFDRWAVENEFEPCELLVIDAHGMEMQVIRGFGAFIFWFETIVIECSQTPVFRGGPSAEEIIRAMDARGFDQKTPILPCGDIRFEKRNLTS